MRKDIVVVGDSNVAVVTLWTKKETVVEKLRGLGVLDKVAVVGTLYTVYGINYLLHTLAENPKVDTLVVFGADLSESGEVLVKLFRDKCFPPGFKSMWRLEEVKPLLESVNVVDLREAFSKEDWSALARAVKENYCRRPSRRPVLRLELKEQITESWPLPVSGQVVYDESLFRAWVKAVASVMAFGVVKNSEYCEKQKQLLNLVVVLNIYGEKYSLEEEFFNYFTRKDFEYHFKSLLNSDKQRGVSYTYGERLRKHPLVGDQLSALIEKLHTKPYTRRAVAVLWNHCTDLESEAPPCILIVQGDVSGDFYNHTVFIRSNDIYSAWALNAYAQIRLAEYIAGKLGIKVGTVTLISCSAHIYEHDWTRAWELVHRHYDCLKAFVPDPRGNLIVNATEHCLEVEHRAPDGKLAHKYIVRDYSDLKPLAVLLAPDHAFYLGWEARKSVSACYL